MSTTAAPLRPSIIPLPALILALAPLRARSRRG